MNCDYMVLDKLIAKSDNVLLVDPAFPVSRKSRNHSDLLPVGLLKIGAYLKSIGVNTKLIRLDSKLDFKDEIISFDPDLVMVTSVFTYWADDVKNAVSYSKKIVPDVPVIVGGIFASLLPEKCKDFTGCDYVIEGIIPEAEGIAPDYSLLGSDEESIDYQIIHGSRGCKRKCGFCGTYIIEPEFTYKKSIRDEVIRKKLVFYDNNLLNNPDIEDLLYELIDLRKEKIISRCESQSGFDGRILRDKPELAVLLKEANFKAPKIAWDGPFKTFDKRKEEIDILVSAGFNPKDISVFMIYNFDLDYEEMEQKRVKCFEWGVQISDCRYRPLDRLDDHYNAYARKPQTNDDYHINCNWSDVKVRSFRRNVRRHNICIRHNMNYYSRFAENKKISKEDSLKFRDMSFDEVKNYLSDAWDPTVVHCVEEDSSKQLRLI